jgi:proteasome lid subunit RPN8/RPN11
MFDVLIYKEGMELPTQGTYFVVAGNGLFMHQNNGVLQSFIKVARISCLDDLNLEESINLSLPKIPADLVWQIKEFFRLVVEKYRAESEVTLYFNPETQVYKIHVPKQSVTHASVQYQRIGTIHLEDMEGFFRVGTIHSHCDFGAFHSGTDIHDESDFNGLHITFGHNDREEFTISTTIVFNGFRKPESSLRFLDGIEAVGDTFRLLPQSDEAKALFSEVAKSWLQNVNQSCLGDELLMSGPLDSQESVAWSDDYKNEQVREHFGQGPFKVFARQNGLVVIQTQDGFAKLSEQFFQRVTE